MSGAGCSRVTHPFAARVPRRAFPLDLHVLSTPPAFVLSQDQTLQQKPVEKQTPAKILTKGNCQRKNTLGTGLSSTLLSSQRTTTHQKQPAQPGDPLPGHSFNFTLALPRRQIRVLPEFAVTEECEGTTKEAQPEPRSPFAG